jgi:hypothetical protein
MIETDTTHILNFDTSKINFLWNQLMKFIMLTLNQEPKQCRRELLTVFKYIAIKLPSLWKILFYYKSKTSENTNQMLHLIIRGRLNNSKSFTCIPL